MKANSKQIGGQHYKGRGVEPWDIVADWGLGFFDGNALKYILRWKLKGGVQDLEKAKHYLEKLIELQR